MQAAQPHRAARDDYACALTEERRRKRLCAGAVVMAGLLALPFGRVKRMAEEITRPFSSGLADAGNENARAVRLRAYDPQFEFYEL